MPRVCVIIACYNAERTIARAIQSILSQTYRDFSLCIVDDASSDNTVDVVRQFDDDRISIMRLANNSGPAVARNRALFVAKEDYIAILDADDYSFPDRLQLQVNYLDTHPSVAIVGAETEKYKQNTNVLVFEQRLSTSNAIRWNQLFKNSFSHSTVMYRREVAIEHGGYEESLASAEDYALFSRIVRDRDASNIRRILTHYDTGAGGISRKRPVQLQHCAATVVMENVNKQTSISISESAALLLHGVQREYPRAAVLEAVSVYQDCFTHFKRSHALSVGEKKEISQILLRDASLRVRMFPGIKYTIIRKLVGNVFKLRFISLFSLSFLKLVFPEQSKRMFRSLKRRFFRNA